MEDLTRKLEDLSCTLDSLDDLIFVLSPEGLFTDVHRPTDSVLLMPPSLFLGRHFREVLSPNSCDHIDKAMAAIAAGNRMHQFEYSLQLGGSLTWWSAKVTPRKASDGTYLGVTILCRDITAHKQEEKRMSELNEALESRLGALPHLHSDDSCLEIQDIFEVSELQKIQDAFATATGVASLITDVNGRPITRPSNFCHLCEHIIRKTPKGLENCMRSDAIIGRVNPNGPVMQPCLSGGLFDGGTSIIAGDRHIANWLIGQVRDPEVSDEALMAYADQIGADREAYRKALSAITVMPRQKFAQVCEALHLIGTQLSRLAYRNIQQARFITERRHLEEQLRQAQKLEAIGQLAGGVAHDFNNILTAQVLQFNLLSRRKDLPEDIHEAIAMLHASANTAAGLTQQLLAFSRRQILQIQILDLGAHFDQILKLMKRMLREDISLSLNIPRDPVLIKADPVMIEQVMMNLILNARDAIKAGGRIWIDLSTDEKAGEACIAVSDNGCGMDEATKSHIFEPFFTTKEVGQGTGLGLATVYGIVQQHKGSISIDSTPGVGSTFRIRLPLVERHERKVPQKPENREEEGRGRGQHILLVEDDENLRNLLSLSLRHIGYQPITARDAREALKVWASRKDQISLLLTDMVMPGDINGTDLAHMLLADKPALKAIVASGYSNELVSKGASFTSGITFLQKPYELQRLAQTMAELLH